MGSIRQMDLSASLRLSGYSFHKEDVIRNQHKSRSTDVIVTDKSDQIIS